MRPSAAVETALPPGSSPQQLSRAASRRRPFSGVHHSDRKPG